MTEVSMATSLREYIIQQWIRSGAPVWSPQETLEQTRLADSFFERQSKNPAPQFRANRHSENQLYMSQWFYGWKFPWLEMQRLGDT